MSSGYRMARISVSVYSQCGKMRPQKVFRFLLLCNILDIVYRVVQAVDGHTQAFIQMDGELRYLVDGVSIQMQESLSTEGTTTVSFTDLEEENLNTYASPIIFDPPSLDFSSHPVGMPHMERVVVQNLSPDTSIHMLSISGSTLHFHCSFFQEKVIPPGGNTTFDVVFLARQEGPVENTLFIHTSLGSFKYQVTAVGGPNPYRLRPFLGVRMPLNSSYSPLIHMHNPYSSTLQLTEMYSSGGDLHLELPSGESEAPRHLWEIPPYETKPVMRANFVARIERNHTAYIRIKTNSSGQEYLVLPVEVEVTSVPGIYSPTEVLDYGVLRSQDEPKRLSISLLNSGQKHINIANVIVTPVNEAVEVKFVPVKVPPDTVWSTQVATVTFFPSKALHAKQCSGKIVIKSKNNQFKLTIPYQVTLLKGSLDYNATATRFYVGQDNKINKTQLLNITNNFNFTVVIHSVFLPEEAKAHFTVNFTKQVVLLPGKTVPTAWLIFHPLDKNLQLTTYLRLHSNISHFDVPLLCFSGKLKVFLPHNTNQSLIDFGTLGMGEKRTMIFAVINENPVDVNLKHWGSSMTKTYVELVGIDKGNASTLAWRHNFSGMAKSFILKPHHYAIFRIGIIAPPSEELFMGEAFVETQYEKIKIQFSVRTAKGSLTADDIYFENAFPGRISSQTLHVYSTFSHAMTVTSITPIPEDSRFQFDFSRNNPPVLLPNTKNPVGKMLFDPRKKCKHKCYSGLPTTTTMGHQWLLGMALPPDVGDMDKELFHNLRRRWQDILDNREKSMNITLQLDTSEVRGYLLKARASLQWPRLSNKCHLRFAVTQIGNTTVKDFALENPSSLPVLVQVVPLALYPSIQTAVDMLSHRLGGDSNIVKQSEHTHQDIFTLQDLEDYNKSPDNSIPAYRKSLEEYFGIQSHKQSIAMLLTPGMRVRVQVGFSPNDDLARTSLILIRNNLTVMDAIVVQGQGGHGQIKFGNKTPGVDATLMFELTEKHLKDCDGSRSSRFVQPNFTVRRAFTARNTGELPVYVRGFGIDGISCEGFGFRVLNCHGFELKPNASKKVDIAFTPDFTLSRVERILHIHTSLGTGGQTLQYMLIATLPRHMLSFCSQALPRPHWEPLLYYCFVSLTGFLLLCVLIAAYFEGDRILKSTFFPLATTTLSVNPEKFDEGQIFDLRSMVGPGSPESQSGRGGGNNGNISEVKRKQDIILGPSGHITESLIASVHSTTQRRGSSSSSFSSSKSKDSVSSTRDPEIESSEFSCKGGKKKLQKNKQNHESSTFLLTQEEESTRLHKGSSHSWAHFLKPPFSFRSCSSENIKKPSVATQTNKESTREKCILKSDESDTYTPELISDYVSSDMEVKNKYKQKSSKEGSKNLENKIKLKKKNEISAEEETSSTTTETSNPESDISEKDQHLPDVCVTSKPLKIRHSKSKGRDHVLHDSETVNTSPTLNRAEEEEMIDDRGFELSTKSKGHKKIKVDPTKVFGGDILCPSTLELPYKPKPVILSHGKDDKQHSDEHRSTSHKNLRQSVSKPKGCRTSLNMDNDNIDIGKNSPPPIWDRPLPFINHDDALSELSQQTETFIMHRSMGGNSWTASHHSGDAVYPFIVGNSARPSTYSAVVSRDGYNSKNKNKSASRNHGDGKKSGETGKKPGPVGQRPNLILPSDTNHSSSSNIVSESFLPPSNVWNTRTTNTNLLLGPTQTSDISTSSSRLASWVQHPLSGRLGFEVDSTTPDTFLKPDGICSLSEECQDQVFSDLFACPSSTTWNNPPMTMMQALQAERRQRLEEYRKQLALYNDWPGFDMPSVTESLWDPSYSPSVDSWANTSVNNTEDDLDLSTKGKMNLTTAGGHDWNDLLDTTWNSVSSLWQPSTTDSCPSIGEASLDLVSQLSLDDTEVNTSTATTCSSPLPTTTTTSTTTTSVASTTLLIPAVTDTSLKKDKNTTSSTGASVEGGFDPFHTLSGLWTPPLTTGDPLNTTPTADTWSFSLFSHSAPSEIGSTGEEEPSPSTQNEDEPATE